LYNEYLKDKRERLAILCLGQTMTTTDGSSYAQANVHETEQDDKFSADEQLILDVLNYDFIEYMKLWFKDFTISDKRFKFVPSTADEVNKKLQHYIKLKELGVVFGDDELREVFKDIL
ncbi:MAG: phage portal protein family protein, partial [bacterium]